MSPGTGRDEAQVEAWPRAREAPTLQAAGWHLVAGCEGGGVCRVGLAETSILLPLPSPFLPELTPAHRQGLPVSPGAHAIPSQPSLELGCESWHCIRFSQMWRGQGGWKGREAPTERSRRFSCSVSLSRVAKMWTSLGLSPGLQVRVW